MAFAARIPTPSRASVFVFAAALVIAACAGAKPPRTPASLLTGPRFTGAGRPCVMTVAREGDPSGALAIATTTEGIAPERGALVAVALAALIEGRLAQRGFSDVQIVGGWDGWRLRALADSPGEAARIVAATRDAMFATVTADDPALNAVTMRVGALSHRPLADRALAPWARCTGDAYGLPGDSPPTAQDLEQWRRAAHGLGRVAVATAGSVAFSDAAASALIEGPAWPDALPIAPEPWPRSELPPLVYDASGEVAPGAARVTIAAWTTAAELAVAVASSLGDPRGSLASRLDGLDTPARVRSVVGTAHAGGGCLAVTIELSPRDLAADAARHIATAAVLARQEVAAHLLDTVVPLGLAPALANRASDPRDAAERAAWWSIAGTRPAPPSDGVAVALAVGIASARGSVEGPGEALFEEIRHEIDRSTHAWDAPVVEPRTRVERGQGEVWVLVGSPCGTLAEATSDAGATAAVAMAAADRAQDDAGSAGRPADDDEAGKAAVEAFVAIDGAGVLAHGAARPGESPGAHARRLADVAARAFAADPLDRDRLSRARALLIARASEPERRALGVLAETLSPGHPSWIEPFGTSFGLASVTDESLRVRASAIRATPLRVAVLGNTDQAQVDAAVQAVDRWVARRPGGLRACPQPPALPAPRPGTYSAELVGGARSEALVALPLGNDAGARAASSWIAAALGGPDGLLAQALGTGDHPTPLASEWSASVLGGPLRASLVVRLVGPEGSLDAAVAQTRALFDRLHRQGMRPAERAHAGSLLARSTFDERLDPHARVIALWRGDPPTPVPTLDELNAYAASAFRDEALVIVSARPARAVPAIPKRAAGR